MIVKIKNPTYKEEKKKKEEWHKWFAWRPILISFDEKYYRYVLFEIIERKGRKCYFSNYSYWHYEYRRIRA